MIVFSFFQNNADCSRSWEIISNLSSLGPRADLFLCLFFRFSLASQNWWNTTLSIPQSLRLESGEEIYGLCGIYYVRLPDKPSPPKMATGSTEISTVVAEPTSGSSQPSGQPFVHWSWKGENWILLQTTNRLAKQGSSSLTKLDLSDATLYNDSLYVIYIYI